MTSPDISVIIPVLDDYRRLQATLDCLAEQVTERSFEVIVADNGTPHDRIPELRAVGFELIEVREERPGSYAARNAALEIARGGLLAFTDADCLPMPDWLERGVAHLERIGPRALVGGAIEVFAQNTHAPTLAEQWELVHAFPQEHYIRDLHFAATANAFTTREVIDEIGPFLSAYASGGDREFGERAWGAGCTLAFEPGAVIRHPARHSMKALLRKVVRTTTGYYRRQREEKNWSAYARGRAIIRAAREIPWGPGHGVGAALGIEGDSGAKLRYAVAETAVHIVRQSSIVYEATRRG